MPDLSEFVQAELARRKGEWRQIADSVPEVSYSWVCQMGRGQYRSAPSYRRLEAVATYLRSTSRSDDSGSAAATQPDQSMSSVPTESDDVVTTGD